MVFSKNFKKFTPLLNRVLIKKFEPVTKTKSGIYIQSNETPNVGVIVSTGPGNFDNGKLQPVNLNIGDHVLLPDFGGSKVELENGEFFLYRDSEILGVLAEKSESN